MTYSFINMMFISTGIFYDKLRPQILLVDTTANAAVNYTWDRQNQSFVITLYTIYIDKLKRFCVAYFLSVYNI
jgi:hypothetical protein